MHIFVSKGQDQAEETASGKREIDCIQGGPTRSNGHVTLNCSSNSSTDDAMKALEFVVEVPEVAEQIGKEGDHENHE